MERLLSLDPDSDECAYLGSKARELARIRSKNMATIGTAFGIDYVPCKASCRFCSFGDKWGLMKGEYYIPDDEIVSMIRSQREKGFRRFTLRTTEFYPVDRISELIKKIRREVPGDYFLAVNMGELSKDDAAYLKECGINWAYHTLHLREGIDTPFRPEMRIATMKAIKEGGLRLTSGVDPIGIEHTDREIAENIDAIRMLEPASICSMARINPKGTPVGDLEEISPGRHALIAAVIVRYKLKSDVDASLVEG
jgi:biotin synthase